MLFNKSILFETATHITSKLIGQAAINNKRVNNPNLIKAPAFAKSLKRVGMNMVQITEQMNAHGFKTRTEKAFLNTSTLRLFK